MNNSSYDVVIVGAGAAGLAALRELDRAGLRVLCVEARDRIGGRIYTMHDPLSAMPIELGAEFIHGRPPEIWQYVHSQCLLICDCASRAVLVRNGCVHRREDGWKLVDKVMNDLRRAAKRGKDRSFADFAASSGRSENAKRLAASYVEGFNAARKEIIGIASLAKDADGSDDIDGDQSFRFVNGYDTLIRQIIAGIGNPPSKLIRNAIGRRIEWKAGHARVHLESALTGDKTALHTKCVLVTVPLGVLKDISFDPEPQPIFEAAGRLQFGQVIRIVLRFKKAFWEAEKELASAGFLLSDEKSFPTWWVQLPIRVPLITGWSAGPHADGLLATTKEEIVGRAVHDLARITAARENRVRNQLEAAYFHDWHADPFARGAYSYVPVGAMRAREVLAVPLAGTLFFAGEATDTKGHSATVHGAIASGLRAARQILSALR